MILPTRRLSKGRILPALRPLIGKPLSQSAQDTIPITARFSRRGSPKVRGVTFCHTRRLRSPQPCQRRVQP